MRTLKKHPLRTGLYILGFLLTFLSFSCGIVQKNPEDNQDLQDLINKKKFEIENNWASPMRGTQINLIGNPNYIRFKNDSVEVYLPYFGVRHTGGGYNSENGIKFEGVPENLNFSTDKKNNTVITFEADQDSENLDFRITLYQNEKASTSVNSSQRDPISYRGNIHDLPEQE